MLYNYFLRVDSDRIVKATPSGYTIKELKTGSYWTDYENSRFTNSIKPGTKPPIKIPDITITNSPRTITNLFDVFIQEKSVTAKNGVNDVTNALNIDTRWDRSFPETIRLRYPGVITNNNFSERTKLEDEKTYIFKIWENRSNTSVGNATVIPDDALPGSISYSDYFNELTSFIKIDGGTSYEEWLKRPSFSLKNLLAKSIEKDGKMYQLYKLNDVNVQSLSSGFDEYIPWCFDQDGKKISQYKISTITSYNKKEIYILLEIRESDVKLVFNDPDYDVKIPILTNVVFWRSGILDPSITMDIRNEDQMLLLRDSYVSNISDYFKESKINTNTLVNFQKDRLENEIFDGTPIDNDDSTNNKYILEYNEDAYFEIKKAKNASSRIIFGKKVDTALNVSMGGDLFTDHMKDRVHIFVNGSLLTTDQFYIMDGYIKSTLTTPDSYVEIFIDQHNSPSYTFNLDSSVASLSQNDLTGILYTNNLLAKTKWDKQYLLFNKTESSNVLVNGDNITTGNYLIIHSLVFDFDDTTDVSGITPSVTTTDDATDVSDTKDYNINYDPLLYRTSVDAGNNNIKDKDVWIFDNSNDLIKIEANEPYLVYNGNNIEVMGELDKNIALLDNNSPDPSTDVSALKDSLENDNIHNLILSSDGDSNEISYIQKHYSQMSTVNRNILNMFLYSGINSWANLNADTEIKLNKDYLVVRYTNNDDFPLLTVHKDGIYNYDGLHDSVQVKVKPAKVVYNYYILHRTSDDFSDLYTYSFNKQIDYIMI